MIEINNVPSKAVIELICAAELGTNGAKYKHLHSRDKINLLHQPYFISIGRNNKAIANINLCKREFEQTNAYYIRYFAFHKNFQSKASKTNQNKSKGVLHNSIENIFKDPNSTFNKKSENQVLYAYIEENNSRSINISDNFGFKTTAIIQTHIFSRVFPRRALNLNIIKDKEQINNLVKNLFKDFEYVFPKHIEYNGYYTHAINNEIVLAMGYQKASWKIYKVGTWIGNIFLKIIPKLPFGKRLINPERHNFLASEGLYVKPGYENLIEKFLSSILTSTGYYQIIIWTDINSLTHKQLKKTKLGLVNKISDSPKIFLRTRGSKNKKSQNKPYYCSGFDFT
jgi:hypothetical protein